MPTAHFPSFSVRKQDAQTLHLPMTGFVRVNSIPIVGSVNSLNITTQLTTALASAARNSRPVPLQRSANEEGRGVVMSGEIISIYSSTTQRKTQLNGIEVFGILSEAAGVYTLTFRQISDLGGITDVLLDSQNISIEVPYRFDIHELPSNAITALSDRNVYQDVENRFEVVQEDVIIVTKNTIPVLSQEPVLNGAVWIEYRGFTMSNSPTANIITVDVPTRTLTFDAVIAGYDLHAGELITIYYTTNG